MYLFTSIYNLISRVSRNFEEKMYFYVGMFVYTYDGGCACKSEGLVDFLLEFNIYNKIILWHHIPRHN